MSEIGYFLASEEHDPGQLVQIAQQAEHVGIRSVWISDHYHPWTDQQGESPFVWSVIGAIAATTQLRLTTAVTCPLIRTHPTIIAHAAATTALMMPGRFLLGVGTGENLNEHIHGDRWPPTPVRLEMLEEAVGIMRALWTGKLTNHHGTHYTVENARIYSCPPKPPPVLISALGPKSTGVAARVADGLITVKPTADAVKSYRDAGGDGVKQVGLKVCWGPDEATARKTAHTLWSNELLPGGITRELPQPAHIAAANTMVTEDQVGEAFPCGPDPERHVAAIEQALEAGFDEVYVSQIGPEQAGFFNFYRQELRPRLERL